MLIPEAGVSVSELSRALRDWLGNETHISGEVWRAPDGIAVTVRSPGKASITFNGGETDLHALLDSAAADAPSMPFALTDWGALLMRRGNDAQAIEKFQQANAAGPHFADPLELWGEALLLDNHPDLALAKFEEANQYAPHWGRLHLKWSEALDRLGSKDEARAQYQLAESLDPRAAAKTGFDARQRGASS